MIKYLINLGMFYQPKNKMHKAIQEFFRGQERKVIAGESIEVYKNYLRENVELINKQFTNCQPVKINIWSCGVNDWGVQIESVVCLSMLQFTDQL